MTNMKHDIFLRLVKLANAMCMSMIFAVIWVQCYGPQQYQTGFYRRGNWLITGIFFFLYFVFGRTYDAFQVSLNKVTEMVFSQTFALIVTDVSMYAITWLLTRHLPTLWPILLIFILQICAAFVWSFLARIWYFRTFTAKKTMVIYDMREGMDRLISEYGLDTKFDTRTVCTIQEALEDPVSSLNGFETVYLCGVHSHERNIILKLCVEQGIQVYVIPRIGDVLMSSAKRMHMYHLPVLRVDRYNPTVEYILLKRLTDILLSGAALILASPIMAVVALAIKSDGGPALYKQVRLTKDGKEFKVLKFRSMRVDAEKDGIARLSTGENDDRITPVGKVIRKFRLDELPQLINILKGDMSIVGPRPERPEIAAEYEKELPEFRLRLQAKAGLTGYAQVYGKYNTIPYDKLVMDLMYIAHPSLLEDLKIMLSTVKILFVPESTEGIDAGATTAMENKESGYRVSEGSES